MRGERIVRIRPARRCERRESTWRIGRERLHVVAQLLPAPKEIDSILDALARIGERAGELWQIPEPRLKDDVAQVHRTIVAVEAADGAVVVGVRIDRDHHRTKAPRLGIDRAQEERPAARRRPRHAAVEEAQSGRGGTRRLRVKPGVDARVAQHEHVAFSEPRPDPGSADRRLETSGARRGVENGVVESGAKSEDVDRVQRPRKRPQREERPFSSGAKPLAAPHGPLFGNG